MGIEEELGISQDIIKIKDTCYDKGINFEIDSTCKNCAIYYSKYLIDKATKEIKIFSGNPEEAVYGNNKFICESLIAANNKGVKITMILEDYFPSPCSNWLYGLKNVRVQQLKVPINKLPKPFNKSTHFLLSDKAAFKAEKRHSSKDYKRYNIESMINFNDKNTGTNLNNNFSKLIPYSEPVNL